MSQQLNRDQENEDSESFSSGNSDSYTTDSDLANWEEHVAENGSLFYAEYILNSKLLQRSGGSNHNEGESDERLVEFARKASLRMRQKARRQQQVCKQLELVITANNRYRFGRRSTAVESILGIRVTPDPRTDCLLFESFIDQPAEQQGQDETDPNLSIKCGDWFKALDDIEVRTSNIDELLMQFVEPTRVRLKFIGLVDEQPPEGENDGGDNAKVSDDLQKIENFPAFTNMFEKMQLMCSSSIASSVEKTTQGVQDFNSSSSLPNESYSHDADELPFAMLILPPKCHQSEQYKNAFYCYPEATTHNFLYKSRGSFLTLNAVLSEELQTRPLTSKLMVQNVQYYVCYRALNGFLVLLAYASKYKSMSEANMFSDELTENLQFSLPTLSLDTFQSMSNEIKEFLHQFCVIQKARLLMTAANHKSCSKTQNCFTFETSLQESRLLSLPKEAQLRIFDALSEMDAMDYRSWNDDPLNTHREFFIHGSVLYYNHFMLVSQLPLDVRQRVEGFLRCRGIFDFLALHTVKDMCIWQEITLPSDPTGRYFLTICSRNNLILAVILKMFPADEALEAKVMPSLFYIEEIQETIDHLISCGVESLARFWSISNKRPELLDILEAEHCETSANEKENKKLEKFIKQKLSSTNSSSSKSNNTINLTGNTASNAPPRSVSYDEMHLCSSLGGSSIHSLTPSEDDSHKRRSANIVNDTNNTNDNNDNNDSDSGSDWENFNTQNSLYACLNAESQSQMTESLWKEINNVIPVKISAGWYNAIYYYVYVDISAGTVFCNSNYKKDTPEHNFLFNEIHKAFHVIHNALQNNRNTRRIQPHESSAASGANFNSHIKEYGLMLEISNTSSTSSELVGENTTSTLDVAAGGGGGGGGGGSSAITTLQNNGTKLKNTRRRFIVVGRRFQAPMREVYVCYHPDVCQNMVELAFRLSFFSVG